MGDSRYKMKKLYISAEKAYNLVQSREDNKTILRLPYKVKTITKEKKIKITNLISLKFLMNAITLSNLNHPETEEPIEPVDIKSITSCYLIGSAIKPKYEKITKKYVFGLYIREKEKIVVPNDIDIMCFVNNSYNMSHIKSMTSWNITISGTYGDHNKPMYGNFDVSYYPASLIHREYEGNKDFIDHIKNSGVCVMGKNIIKAKKYASWSHDTLKDEITCYVPREPNTSGETEEETKVERFEMLDL